MFVPLLENSIVTFSGPWNIDEAQDHFVAAKDWMGLPGCEEASLTLPSPSKSTRVTPCHQ